MVKIECSCGHVFYIESSGCYKCDGCNLINCNVTITAMNKAVVRFETISNTPSDNAHNHQDN